MTTDHLTPRIDMTAHAGGPYAAMVRVSERIELDPRLKHLVELRASQINGCAFCLDMHWTAAKAHGESDLRLAQLAAWDESPAFDERERAALALTEAMTHVADTHVPDDVWARARRHFDERELAHLVVQIAAINFWNRVAVASRAVPAGYAPAAAA
ncbi:MAG: carboxymuconolactone decarboxylase family protein [Solirubrobacteraceae bacterium]|nr:carboxymuconolactone decarboxylase family protein [Solirubrobacteraceae bacterium]